VGMQDNYSKSYLKLIV